ncbi:MULTISPECIES: hypothetical protein, partial [unclassified Streptomyces]
MPADDTADRRPVRRIFTDPRREGTGPGGFEDGVPSHDARHRTSRSDPPRPSGRPPGPRPALHRWGLTGGPVLAGPPVG